MSLVQVVVFGVGVAGNVLVPVATIPAIRWANRSDAPPDEAPDAYDLAYLAGEDLPHGARARGRNSLAGKIHSRVCP